jgi:hypothetical protein
MLPDTDAGEGLVGCLAGLFVIKQDLCPRGVGGYLQRTFRPFPECNGEECEGQFEISACPFVLQRAVIFRSIESVTSQSTVPKYSP